MWCLVISVQTFVCMNIGTGVGAFVIALRCAWLVGCCRLLHMRRHAPRTRGPGPVLLQLALALAVPAGGTGASTSAVCVRVRLGGAWAWHLYQGRGPAPRPGVYCAANFPGLNFL